MGLWSLDSNTNRFNGWTVVSSCYLTTSHWNGWIMVLWLELCFNLNCPVKLKSVGMICSPRIMWNEAGHDMTPFGHVCSSRHLFPTMWDKERIEGQTNVKPPFIKSLLTRAQIVSTVERSYHFVPWLQVIETVKWSFDLNTNHLNGWTKWIALQMPWLPSILVRHGLFALHMRL